MWDLDEAIKIYTDKVNAEEEIDFSEFENNLNQSDWSAFKDTLEPFDMLHSIKITQQFESVFNRIDARKHELYDFKSAANFRATEEVNDDVLQKLTDLFNEEFGDE